MPGGAQAFRVSGEEEVEPRSARSSRRKSSNRGARGARGGRARPGLTPGRPGGESLSCAAASGPPSPGVAVAPPSVAPSGVARSPRPPRSGQRRAGGLGQRPARRGEDHLSDAIQVDLASADARLTTQSLIRMRQRPLGDTNVFTGPAGDQPEASRYAFTTRPAWSFESSSRSTSLASSRSAISEARARSMGAPTYRSSFDGGASRSSRSSRIDGAWACGRKSFDEVPARGRIDDRGRTACTTPPGCGTRAPPIVVA